MSVVNLDTCPIELYEARRQSGQSVADLAGDRMEHRWEAGVWEENLEAGKVRRVFGLVYWGQVSYMAYELACEDYPHGHFDPCQVIVRLDQPGHGRFYFDAGGNGRPIWADRDALAEVFVRLGLISTDWGWAPGDDGADNQATSTQGDTDA